MIVHRFSISRKFKFTKTNPDKLAVVDRLCGIIRFIGSLDECSEWIGFRQGLVEIRRPY